MKSILRSLLRPLRPDRTYGPRSLQGMRHAEVVELLEANLVRRGLGSELRFLDVGCGEGQLLLACAQPGRHLAGCDWLENPQARDRIEYSRVDLNGSGLDIYADAAFDIVLCSDVLEHMENPARILRDIARVLTDKGLAVLSIPNSWNLMERIRFLLSAGFRRYRAERVSGPWGHISFFTRETLQSLCDRAGLNIERLAGGGRRGHLAIGGIFLRVPPSLLLSYNVYIVLGKGATPSGRPGRETD